MARISLALGTSHTPLLTFGAAYWQDYATRDFRNARLNLSDGSFLPYGELEGRTGGRFGSEATPERFRVKEKACQDALDRLAAALEQAAPDLVVIVTDDETELFSRSNTPAVSIYYGETILTRPYSPKRLKLTEPMPAWFDGMVKTFSMDRTKELPAAPAFARDLIGRMIEKHVDMGAAAQIEDPQHSGIGHGVGFVAQRLLRGRPVPIVPVLLNTYYPPNAPLPARCFDIGRTLREAIEAMPGSERVALVASGGLSHFVVDEALDRKVIGAMLEGRPDELRRIPPGALNAGSSEIRNWIAMAGALDGMKNEWLEYQPIYRTPAGTGVGAAFGVWR